MVKDHSRNTSSTSSFSNHKADTADEEIALEPIKTVRTNRTSRTNRSSIAEVNYALPLQDLSRNIVGWDGIDDAEDPRNWPLKRKISVMVLLSCITFIRQVISGLDCMTKLVLTVVQSSCILHVRPRCVFHDDRVWEL